jgi:anaerobic selenocysteine-containing dehydrogenase
MTIRTIACLPALIGGYTKPGSGCFCGTSTGAAFAMKEITREDFIGTPTRVVNMNQLGNALTDLSDPPVMSLYVYHSNPAAITPDQNRVIAGLSRDNLFTVVHERFMTDTARYADLVLPATSSLEHSDIYRSYGHYCIQRARPAIPPVGESKSNWELFSLLAVKMGFEEQFFRQSADDLIDQLLSIPSPWRNRIDIAKFGAGMAVELNPPHDPDLLFATESGKIRILNTDLPERLPRFIPPHSWEEKEPFRLMTAPALYGLNSSFFEREDLRNKQGGMRLQINPLDAEEKRLMDGEAVTAWNSRGEADFLVKISDRVPRRVVVAEGAWWIEHAPGIRTVNALTTQRLTDMGRGSTFYDTRVDLKKTGM